MCIAVVCVCVCVCVRARARAWDLLHLLGLLIYSFHKFWENFSCFFLKNLFLIGGKLLYNSVLVSAI